MHELRDAQDQLVAQLTRMSARLHAWVKHVCQWRAGLSRWQQGLPSTLSLLFNEPVPHWPYRFEPKVYDSPSLVTTAE